MDKGKERERERFHTRRKYVQNTMKCKTLLLPLNMNEGKLGNYI